ncbi:MAG: hypothetical protein ACREC8_03415 [Limisphaerales bacterium]
MNRLRLLFDGLGLRVFRSFKLVGGLIFCEIKFFLNLGLTKNQAPSQVEDVADNENEEKISQQQTHVKSNGQTRRTTVRV